MPASNDRRIDLPPLEELMAAAVAAVGGTPRSGQNQMAEAVDEAMAEQQHLLVQAGTGTGKSLAYLVPAIRHALESGRPVVITTATIALQNQIVRKDLPRIVESLAPLLPRTPTFALLKGRANYACLHKLDGGYPDDSDSQALFATVSARDSGSSAQRLGDQVRRLREWAEETDTGDRDDLDRPVSDRAWRQVSVTGSQCLGSSCPMVESCFVERNRAIARDVDIVVTNHALMAIDAFDGHGILPEHDVLVVDEAHDLVDRVTSAVTDSLAAPMVTHAVRELRGLGMAATALDDAGESLRSALELMPDGRVIGTLPPQLTDALLVLRTEAKDAHTEAKDAGGGGGADHATAGARKAVRADLQEIIDVAERLLSPADDDVLSVSHSEATGRSSIQAAPLSVAGAMRGAVLEDTTVVLTSATLALGGRFEPPAGSVGLRADARRESAGRGGGRDAWRGIDVGSPFDYPRQGILYVARHLPPPGREGPSTAMLDHLTELVEASDGGALCLFSSRRGAELAAEHVRARTSLPIGLQGEDSISSLVRGFRDEDRMSLFGTLSLWQGVDVQGRTCRLVTIDRIPFPRPDEPLTAARQERIAKRGGNGFMSVSAQHAALLLAQGAGRLIRSQEDRGMVAVLDPRLATARYGAFLTSAMPPLWRTQDPATALAALGRLAAA